ncbi:MAG: HAMP domain-containing histidine kinase [Clostridium sp.]|nr:HAMP domain-containing histidine kinase [Clostridium sp.]MBS6251774.1 HAMP domain-containing histidine kinase [Clostridium sp.]
MMFLLELFFPALIVAILLFVFNTESELVLRISTVVFSFSAVFAIFSYMLNKRFFANKLIETAKASNNDINGIRIQLYKKLLIQILPLFLYSFVLILLISISLMTEEKGSLLYHFYRQELLSKFDEGKTYSIDEIKKILDTIEFKSEGDHALIMSANNGKVVYSPEELNQFFINYTLDFYDKTEGYTYEYYGQNREGAVIKVKTDIGDCYVGIRYFVFANNFVTPFIYIALLLIALNSLFILYIGKDLSNDIDHVVTGLKNISNSENVVYANNLPITSNDEIGDLTSSFNEIQKITKNYVDQIHSSQESLMESERLASLGQLIGGIAHNLKTPIMSISGAIEGLSDLIKEYDSSIDDPEVNHQDHHEIASDMNELIVKIRDYIEYMSDIITAVKGQAVTLSESDTIYFTVDELVKRVNILMKHELKNAIVYLNIGVKTNEDLALKGDINSLVQVINNMISNSIQAYNGKPEQEIDLIVEIRDNNLIISIKDYASGLPKKVQDKLFKEMITTKGKNGTGLGLYMSYSTIKAHFNGDIQFETEEGKGTTFYIVLPLDLNK